MSKCVSAAPPFVAPIPVYFDDSQGELGNGAIAIGADTLVVSGSSGGNMLVYVYADISGVWVEAARLTTSDPQYKVNGYGQFGMSLAVSADGNTVFVGDPTAACASNANLPCGAVYIYRKPPAGWTSTGTPSAKLVVATAGSQELGFRVALSSDGLTLAALGDAVYIFTQPAGGWTSGTQTAILGSPSGTGHVQSGSLAGLSVDGNVVAVNTTAQSVLVYVGPAAGWQDMTSATAVLTNSASGFDSSLGDFGSSLQVSGSFILVGAPAISSALLYQEPATGWATTNTATAELQPPNNAPNFASGIGMVEGTAVVSQSDSVDFYDQPASGWSTEAPAGGDFLPSYPALYPILQYGNVYASGSELATSSAAQCDDGIVPLCVAGFVLSETPASSNYDGLMIDYATIDDVTTGSVRTTSGFTGDVLHFNFDVQNVGAPEPGTATLTLTGSGGTLTAANVNGSNCTLSGGSASCKLSLAAGQNVTAQATEQTSGTSTSAAVTAVLSNVSPATWDPLNGSLTASLPLAPAPVVPAQTTFTGGSGSEIMGTLPVTYIGSNVLVFTVTRPPFEGTLNVDSATGAFTWTPPDSSFSGSTQFYYQVSDGPNTSTIGSVILNEGSFSSGGGGAVGLIALLALAAAVGFKWLQMRYT